MAALSVVSTPPRAASASKECLGKAFCQVLSSVDIFRCSEPLISTDGSHMKLLW